MQQYELSTPGILFIKDNEGCILKPYKKSADRWTIGIGTTYYPNGKPVTENDPVITEEDAERFLTFVCDKICTQMSELITVVLDQYQTDALIDFIYNVGIKNFTNSTLLKKLNLGYYEAAADEFLVWKYASGQVMVGLEKRRQRELELFINENYNS